MPKRIRPLPARRRTFIRQWREFRGLTQDQLAERLEMSKAQLSRIETGKQPYTQDFLEACADALLTDTGSLTMRDPSDPEAPWTIWDSLKPVERKKAVKMIEGLRRKTG